ncbi:MAG: TPM domain-containing protein [Selenomonas massiliensis]
MNGNRGARTLFAFLLAVTLLLLGDAPQVDAAESRLRGTMSVTAGELLAKPAQRAYVVDTAGMVATEDAAQIAKIGAELRAKTKAEIVVVTVATLGGTDIESYANDLFRSWGIGDAQLNNGVLLLIAKDDRAFRIEVGYGLEGAITDGYAGSVLDAMKGEFRKENYSPAILQAYVTLAQKAGAEYGVALESLGAALGIPAKPAQLGTVADFGDMLMPEDAAAIEQMGGDLTNATGAQMIVVTMPTLRGVDARRFAQQLFADWQLKDAAQGNTALLFIAKEEREVCFLFGPALTEMEQEYETTYAVNRIRSEFPFDKDDISEEIRKGYATVGARLCEKAHVAVPDSIDEGGSEPFYVYLLGFLVFIPFLLLLLWIVGQVFGLAFFSLAALLNLLSSGRYGHMPSGSGGGTYDDDDDRPTYRGGGGSGGGSYGGGSSGGGGASGNW